MRSAAGARASPASFAVAQPVTERRHVQFRLGLPCCYFPCGPNQVGTIGELRSDVSQSFKRTQSGPVEDKRYQGTQQRGRSERHRYLLCSGHTYAAFASQNIPTQRRRDIF